MIPRIKFSSDLKSHLQQFPVAGIIGPRQIGKTTLVKLLIEEIKGIYLDLESDQDQVKLSEPGLYLRQNKDKCIVLDEIQVRQDLFPLLKGLIDEDRRPGRFMLLGSASPILLRQSSDSLAGRIAYSELYPFQLSEVGFQNQQNLWIKGGFPLSFLNDDSNSLEWRKQFIKTYIERDLPSLGLDTDQRTLRNFMRMLAANTGQLWNASSFAASVGVTAPTVKRYLSFLEHAFLVRVLEPYYTNLSKRLVKSPKVYYKDTGILHAMLNVTDLGMLTGHPIIGFSWENFVVNQIIFHLGDKFEYFFFRTHQGAEIDLLLVRSGQPVTGIEIKYSNAPKVSKGYLTAIEDVKLEKNFIITPSSDRFPVHTKIEAISLGVFLAEASNDL